MKSTKLALAVGISMLTFSSALAQEIKFGFNGDLSASPSALSGQAAVIGIELAIKDINEAGGLNGQKVVLEKRDDLSAPPKSIQNMSDLIDNEKVVTVFGPSNSGNALAWKHLPNGKHVISMGCIGSGTEITYPVAGQDNYMFRVSMVDKSQVAAIMAYVAKSGKDKKLGYIVESTGYGQGALKDLEAIQVLHGMKPELVETIGVNDTDATSQLSKLQAAGVETVVVWAQGTAIGQVLRSMEKLNYFPMTLTSWAADNASFFNLAGPKLAEIPIFMRTIPSDYEGKLAEYYDRVKDQLPSPGSFSFAAHCYDATMIFAQAARQANSTDGPALKAALENLSESYEGAIKTYDKPFSAEDHEALKASDFRFTRWKDSKLVEYSDAVIESLAPEDYKQ